MTRYLLWVLRGKQHTEGMTVHHLEEGYYKEQVVQRVRSEHWKVWGTEKRQVQRALVL